MKKMSFLGEPDQKKNFFWILFLRLDCPFKSRFCIGNQLHFADSILKFNFTSRIQFSNSTSLHGFNFKIRSREIQLLNSKSVDSAFKFIWFRPCIKLAEKKQILEKWRKWVFWENQIKKKTFLNFVFEAGLLPQV